MKATAEKSATTTSPTATQTTSQPFFAKAGSGGFFDSAKPVSVPGVQMKMTVNRPGDKFEQEADRMADKVMRMPAPEKKEDDKIQKAARPEEKVQRAEKKEEEKIQRKSSDGTPAPGADTQSAIQNRTTGGQPLSADVRSYMEPRFGTDFSNVRIHSDAESAGLSNQLSARAFTYQNHVFFSRDQYQPGTSEGRQLLAHELTHTIQQGHAVQRSPQVSTTTTPPPIQRLGIDDALDYFANAAYNIPGFRMFTIIIGVNPINMQSTDRSAANILRAIVEFLPGGNLITRVLDHYGVLERAGSFVEQQLNGLGISGSSIRDAVMRFLNSLGWRDIFRLGSVWERAQRIFTEPIGRLIGLARNLFTVIKQFIWDAVLRPLASLAARTSGYDLIKAILGRDPITGDAYPRTADTLIGGFMKLIGQEEVWENIKRGNAVGRAWAWFQGVVSELLGFVTQIPTLFINTLRSLELGDFLIITSAFGRIIGAFGNFVGNFISWAGGKVLSLLEILFSVVAPGAMPFIQRAAGAFQLILRNPVGFVGNLVRAGVQGFRQFSTNILTHLRAGLVGWLTGALTGLTLPTEWNFRGILSLVLQVLGLTWPNMRGRLVRALGERPVAVLETTFGLVTTLVREGPVAAWRELMQHLGNLQEMLFGQIRTWIQNTIVGQAVLRIVSMLNPAGAVIQAIIAIYNTIMFFVERMRQIGAVVESVVNSLSSIAAGAIGPAANAVEQTMARLVPVVISFLARLIGLGGISQQIQNILRRIQQPINNAIDRVVAWIVTQARRLVSSVAQGGNNNNSDPEKAAKIKVGLAQLHSDGVKLRQQKSVLQKDAEQVASSVKSKHPVFASIRVIPGSETWDYEYVASPPVKEKGDILRETVEISEADLLLEEKVHIGSWNVYLSALVKGTKIDWGLVSVPLGKDNLPPPKPEHSMILENRQGLEGKPIKIKLKGGSLTDYSLRKSIELYESRYGRLTELHGSLEQLNLANFQKEFAIRRKQEMDKEPAAAEAIRSISFGRARMKLGFVNFTVTLSGEKIINIPTVGNSYVPTKVSVTAFK